MNMKQEVPSVPCKGLLTAAGSKASRHKTKPLNRKVLNLGLLASLSMSSIALLMGDKKLHGSLGYVFLGLCSAHTIVNRKIMMKQIVPKKKEQKNEDHSSAKQVNHKISVA